MDRRQLLVGGAALALAPVPTPAVLLYEGPPAVWFHPDQAVGEAHRFQVEEIARAFNVPPHLLLGPRL